MQDNCTFEYAVIRVVPKVEREEFVNVGVLLYSKRMRFLDMKFAIHTDKILALDPEADLEMIQKTLKAWKEICAGGTKAGAIGALEQADRFRWLSAAKSTILQCSPTHPGLCGDPDKELQNAFDRFVK